jgi:outer membrane protein
VSLARAVAIALLIAVTARTGAAAADEALTLSRAIEIGRERAPALAAARAHRDSAEANVSEVSAGYFPTLTASVSGTGAGLHDLQPTSPPVPAGQPLLYVYNNDSLAGNVAGSIRWTLFDFGRTAGSVRAARGIHASAEASAANVELGVVNDVANAFITLYFKEQLRDVMRVTLAQREKLVALAHGMIGAGLMPALEEIRAAARAEAARTQLAQAEGDAADARAVLASALGMDPESPLEVAPPRLQTFDMAVPMATSAADDLPPVTSAEADCETKRGFEENAKARYFPVISLAIDSYYRLTQSKGTVGGLEVDPPFPLNTASLTGTLTLTVPLFDASIAPNLRGARLDLDSATATAAQTHRDARSEAARAVLAVRASSLEVGHARKAAEDAAGVLTIVQARYVQGLSSPLDLIDAESSDFAARVDRTQAEFAYALAVVRALSATGRPIVESPR